MLLASLTLAACAPVYVTAPAGGDVLPVEAGHIVAMATATAAAQATQIALATATDQAARATSTSARQATLDALADRQSLATLSAAETQDVVGATANAAGTQESAHVAALASAQAATATAQLAQALATEQVRREQQRTEVETASGAGTAVLKLMLAVALAFGLWFGARWLAGVVEADLTRRRNAAALRDTPLGPVIMIADPAGVLSARLLAAPAPAPAPERVVENAPRAETIPYTVNGKAAQPIAAEWRVPELDEERRQVVDLVRAAIAIEGEGGHRIPRYANLPGWETNAEGWKKLTDRLMLAGHVTKSSGSAGGTFLTKGRTLYQLLAGLLDGSLPLAPVEVVQGVRENVLPNIS